MRNKLFVIFGGQAGDRARRSVGPIGRSRAEPNLDLLNESPCLQCDLYIENTICPYVMACSKIDEFQRVAAVHCTLYKDNDLFTILKI